MKALDKFQMTNGPVLVVAPSRKTRGGITAVVTAYESSSLWQIWDCLWIETHIDRSIVAKLFYFIRSFLVYLFWLPRCKMVHVHISEPVGAIRKSFFAIPAFALRKPVILHFHSFSPETTIAGKWSALYRYLFVRANRVIVLSHYWRDAVNAAFGDLLVEVLLNPCPKLAEKQITPRDPRPYVLFAGSIIQRKGYADLIRAFSLVSSKHPDWDLVLAGNGELDSASRLAQDLGIMPRLRLPGWISSSQKHQEFQGASIFCLPSYAEGFPMAILDALAYGLPIVTTPVGGIPDALEDGISAILIPPGDIEKLAEALDRVMSSPDLRTALSKKSQSLAAEQFSLNSICQQLDHIYREIMTSR